MGELRIESFSVIPKIAARTPPEIPGKIKPNAITIPLIIFWKSKIT